MPEVTRPFDRENAGHDAVAVSAAAHEPDSLVAMPPPHSVWAAILRGLKGRCPRCNGARLFRKFLKPVDTCPACGQDWTPQRADDFPAYVSILVTGHVMAPVIIGLVQETQLPVWALATIAVTLALLLIIATLQPAKGGIIAMQWWFEMHGFQRDKPETGEAIDEPVPEHLK